MKDCFMHSRLKRKRKTINYVMEKTMEGPDITASNVLVWEGNKIRLAINTARQHYFCFCFYIIQKENKGITGLL